jgi:hypothetical protein
VLEELSRRHGLYRAMRIAADVVEIDVAELADIGADIGAQMLTDELRSEASPIATNQFYALDHKLAYPQC